MTRGRFLPRAAFEATAAYRLLPCRFESLRDGRYIVTNDVGEYVAMDRPTLVQFVTGSLKSSNATYRALLSRHMLFDSPNSAALDLLPLKVRSRMENVVALTGLHIFVVTLRCDQSCQYCQVSRQSEDSVRFDMSAEHAQRAVEISFGSPNKNLKFEFQGGEPLLNFSRVVQIVEYAKALNLSAERNLQFVIASNLSRLDDEILSFCREHGVFLSTSLDGPRDLHDAQRRGSGASTHAATIEGIQHAREVLGHDAVSALMTTTPASLPRVEEIVDEYVRNGFHSIFLRPLSPYGFAARSLVQRYESSQWGEFYRRGLCHVLRINAQGWPMREDFTSILMQKIAAPRGSSYVNLQSPAGLGIGALVYNYDGVVYGSDEGRMLAEMGDDTFRIGHVETDSFDSLLSSEKLHAWLNESLPESSPMCSDCAFVPYCGSDPDFHFATQRDIVGHKAFSEYCRRQMDSIRFVIELLEGDPAVRDTLLQWV